MFHTMRRQRRSLRIGSLWQHVGSAALLAALLVSGNVIQANEPSPQEPDRTRDVPWLLGDWNGRRVWLQDRGLDLQLGYTGEFAFNATGGVRQQAAYADQYLAGATWDLERLAGLKGMTFQATVTARTGRNLSDDVTMGTLQQVQEIYGRGQALRLTQLWVNQRLFDGRIDWKVGRMTFGEDFVFVPVRVREPHLLWRCARQPRSRLYLQLAGQPVGDAAAL